MYSDYQKLLLIIIKNGWYFVYNKGLGDTCRDTDLSTSTVVDIYSNSTL